MNSLSSNFACITSEMDRYSSGHCFVIKILNLDEIRIISPSFSDILKDLEAIVIKCCQKRKLEFSSFVINDDEVFLIVGTLKQKTINDLAFEIYSSAQLYINDKLPAIYMHCCISSGEFRSSSDKAEEIYYALIALMLERIPGKYYYNLSWRNVIDKMLKKSNALKLLKEALAHNTVKFAYQPIVDRQTGEIPYYECLLRYPDEEGNFTSIGSVIEEAEKRGLNHVIDRAAFKMAVKELVRAPNLSLSVNISNSGILDRSLLNFAQDLLTKHKVASRLILEITETSLNNDFEWTKHFIDRLHAFGCKIALDDFGSGFTSLKQLKNLPIDIIKIDGSYIRDILSNDRSKYFVQELIKLSEELGIKTVAEFVEDGAIAKFLIDIKIDGMQGNFFSPASNNII